VTRGRLADTVTPMTQEHGSQVPADPAGRDDRLRRSYSLDGHRVEAAPITPGLHIVSTPIGNLGDITLRALSTLAAADLIACEDTRVTRKLLDRYAIAAPVTPYHDHNATTARPKLLQRLAEGAAIALVSDAGTPLISDPGYKLVRAVREAGYPVTAIPGASSILAALAVAGLPTDQFFFVGFLPRLAEALADLTAGLGEREAAVCRELTKLHEEVRRHPLKTLAQASANQETRGEFVLVIAPPPADAAPRAEDADALLRAALARTSLKEAVGEVMVATGLPRRTLYQRALALADETDKDGD
jgi:16S rRNA (cytidine1402-2'-O)-methyltransferase